MRGLSRGGRDVEAIPKEKKKSHPRGRKSRIRFPVLFMSLVRSRIIASGTERVNSISLDIRSGPKIVGREEN